MAPGVYFSDPGAESSPTVWKKNEGGDTCSAGEIKIPQNLHPLHTRASKGAASICKHGFNP